MKMEKSIKNKKIDLMKMDEEFRTKMLGLTTRAKFELQNDSYLVKDIKKKSLESAQDLINEYIVATYLIGRVKANRALEKEDDLTLGREDLKNIVDLKESCVTDYTKILDDMIKKKEEGTL